MTFTFMVAMASSVYPSLGQVFKNPVLIIVAAVIACPATIALAFESVRRRVPLNYALLTVVTVCETCLVSAVTADYESQSVMQATRALAFVTGSLYFAAVHTKFTQQMARNFFIAIVAALAL